MQGLAGLVGLLALAGVLATCGTNRQAGAPDAVPADAADGSGGDVTDDGSGHGGDAEDAAEDDATDATDDAADGSGDDADGSGDDADDADIEFADTTGDTGGAGPYGPCDPGQPGACAEGSFCREVCPADGPAVGFCTVTERDSCGCGGVFDPCDTAGTTCLMPSCCDYWGLCVTPDEGDSICAGPFAEHFDCADWAFSGGALPEGRCRDDRDCAGPDFCQEPGYELGCGICFEPEVTCESDGDCAEAGEGPWICEWSTPSDCHCSPSRICKRGCAADGECDEGAACGDDARCRPAICGADGDCPPTFACVAGACERRACDAAEDCPGAHCVNARCHTALGTCGSLPP